MCWNQIRIYFKRICVEKNNSDLADAITNIYSDLMIYSTCNLNYFEVLRSTLNMIFCVTNCVCLAQH